eukprot:12382983-Alexandrium_andersonii.AAC.1
MVWATQFHKKAGARSSWLVALAGHIAWATLFLSRSPLLLLLSPSRARAAVATPCQRWRRDRAPR